MTSAPPAPPEEAAQVKASPRRIVREAFTLLWNRPRELMLPMLAVQLPVALVTVAATVICYLTVFEDEPVRTPTELFEDGARGPLFLFLVVSAIDTLFAQVARAATIVSVAEVDAGRTPTLTGALDPAFTRMGGLLLLLVILAAAGVGLLLALIGIILVPFLFIRTLLVLEVFMLEPGMSPVRAIGRAWALTRGRFFRTLGTFALAAFAVLLPFLVVSLLGTFRGDDRTADLLLVGLGTFIQTLAAIPIIAFITAALTLLYLRYREEEGV